MSYIASTKPFTLPQSLSLIIFTATAPPFLTPHRPLSHEPNIVPCSSLLHLDPSCLFMACFLYGPCTVTMLMEENPLPYSRPCLQTPERDGYAVVLMGYTCGMKGCSWLLCLFLSPFQSGACFASHSLHQNGFPKSPGTAEWLDIYCLPQSLFCWVARLYRTLVIPPHPLKPPVP